MSNEAYAITDRGRGPEIAGSRITVYDVLVETQGGTAVAELARVWQLEVGQIELALRYIEEHKEEVLHNWAAIQARHARQHAENESKFAVQLAASHAKAQKIRLELLARHTEKIDASRTVDGHQHSRSNGSGAEYS